MSQKQMYQDKVDSNEIEDILITHTKDEVSLNFDGRWVNLPYDRAKLLFFRMWKVLNDMQIENREKVCPNCGEPYGLIQVYCHKCMSEL